LNLAFGFFTLHPTMSNPEAKTQIDVLTAELKEHKLHNYRYYVLAEPSISDFDFDQKLKQLESARKTISGPCTRRFPYQSSWRRHYQKL
jgi:NAD-dependent DNA ligase